MRLQARGAIRRPTLGLSLVELMVGIAVGLMVVAGASYITVNQLADNRRLLLETQVQQDLRAAADMVARDLRRAGYWGAAESGLWYPGGALPPVNPYAATTPGAASAPVSQVTYAFSRDVLEDGTVDDNKERFGFKLEGGIIKMLVGGSWQALTDSNVMQVTRFDVAVQTQPVVLSCFKECPGGGTACWPTQAVRRFTVQIEGRAVADASVVRSVRDFVRVRNDIADGECPI